MFRNNRDTRGPGELRASCRRGGTRRTGRRVEAAVHFVAGGLFGVLMRWIEGRARDVDEVDGLFRRLAIPAVRAVLR